jgi:hypothetical protein
VCGCAQPLVVREDEWLISFFTASIQGLLKITAAVGPRTSAFVVRGVSLVSACSRLIQGSYSLKKRHCYMTTNRRGPTLSSHTVPTGYGRLTRYTFWRPTLRSHG